MKLIINLKKPIFDNNKIIKFETKYIYEINIINDIITCIKALFMLL